MKVSLSRFLGQTELEGCCPRSMICLWLLSPTSEKKNGMMLAPISDIVDNASNSIVRSGEISLNTEFGRSHHEWYRRVTNLDLADDDALPIHGDQFSRPE